MRSRGQSSEFFDLKKFIQNLTSNMRPKEATVATGLRLELDNARKRRFGFPT